MKNPYFLTLLVASAWIGSHPVVQAQQKKPVDVLSTAVVSNASKGDPAVTMYRKGEVGSADEFQPPVRITYVARTDSTDLRIGYAASQIIFNWKDDPAQLRIDGGPADGKHLNGAGQIPKGKFVTIIQEVTPTRMTISVDGIQRASWSADFSHVSEQIRVFPKDSVVTVQSITAERLQ